MARKDYSDRMIHVIKYVCEGTATSIDEGIKIS
jgi:hypothetical protein